MIEASSPARYIAFVVAAAWLCLTAAACVSARFLEDPARYADRAEELQQRVGRNPEDVAALRDLGVIHLRTNDFARANDYLTRAYALNNDDPKILFHLGLVSEALAKHDVAFRLYSRYPEVSRISPYRRLMAGRYAWLAQRRMEEDIRARVLDEEDLVNVPLEPRIVAVYPLTYQGTSEEYAFLGRGLAELISLDLGHVSELQLVERARLQDLLDELALSKGASFDPATAPRVGRLVGAGRLVGGVYDVLSTDLRLDAALWEAGRAEPASLPAQTDAVRNFFEAEKRLVFDLIDEMGIELSPEEQQRIEPIPTDNLQAFLAFSRGLEREDAGAYGEAAQFYQAAARLDPSFVMARERAELANDMARVAGPFDEALAAAMDVDGDLRDLLVITPRIDPMTLQLQTLNDNLGMGVLPGVDRRNPAQEGIGGGQIGTGSLPDPPRPPSAGAE